MDIIDRLETYYKDNGIHSLNFTCQHKLECSSNDKDFTGPKSAFIPDKYYNSYPRIAFLSLDSGDGESEPNERTPRAVRRQEQIECIVENLPRGRHWYETRFWTQKIYNSISSDKISLEETKNYFCHLNSAKCCQNKDGRAEADATLFRNCRKYLFQELKIISPQILITQGNHARNAVNDIFKNIDTLYENMFFVYSSMKFLWIRTYHPSAYGYYYRQKRNLDNIIDVLNKHIYRVV